MLTNHPIWPITITAVGYWLLGLSAGFFAIPPGYASPIWPASGFALFMILRFGKAAALGILLASFLLNLRFSNASLWQYSEAWILAAMIATGAAAQSLTARFLILKLTRYPQLSTQANDTLLIGLIGGPIACFVSATIGVASLLVNGILQPSDFMVNWTNWWIGDSIGALIFCPIIIATCIGIRWTNQSKLFSFFLIYLFLIAIASALFVQVRTTEEQKIEAIFTEKTESIHRSVEKQLQTVIQSSNALASFMSTVPDVTFKQFRKFTANAFQQSLGAQAHSWVPLVKNNQRKHFEQALSKHHERPIVFYQMSEEGKAINAEQKPLYYPVYYIEPLSSNADAVGFDLASNPDRYAAIELAIQYLSPVATAPVVLVQEHEEQHSFLLINPVLNSSQANDEQIHGFVSSVYRANDIINAALNDVQRKDIEVTIKDVTATGNERLFYQNNLEGSGLERTQFLEFAKRRWAITYKSTNDFLKFYQSLNAWVVLIAGFFIVTIFGLFILLLLGRSAIIEAEVKDKTQALKQALQQAQAASEVKTAFLANMSHELRTPLNSIIGFSQRLLKNHANTMDDRGLDSLETIQRNGQHLLFLINDVLDISKIEAGKMEIHKEYTNVNTLVEQAIRVMRPKIDEKSITISCGRSPIDEINVDPQRILQVIINLLSNAIKFTEAGSIGIQFTAAHKNEKAGLNIHISDTGRGIPAEEVSKLFKRFEQLGNTFKAGEMSTGLGLSVTRELVAMHQGEVSVESKINIGSTFTVWLPIN